MKTKQQIEDEIERLKKLRKGFRPGSYLNDVADGRIEALTWVLEKK